MSVAALLALLLLAPPAPGSALERFFVGITAGSGHVDVVMSGRHTMRDRSRGRMNAEGALVLDQLVEEEGKPARRHAWRLLRASGNRITGTISDVSGAVSGELTGNMLHLRYRMKEGPSVEQWIKLQPGGRVAKNRMVFHRFGLKVATVQSEVEHLHIPYPGPVRLLPEDGEAALEVRFMDRFFDNHVMSAMQKPVAEALRPDGGRRDEALAAAAVALETACAWLEARLAGRTWAAGDTFSMADCAAAPALFYADWVHRVGEGHPRVRAYRSRLLARPSVARAMEEGLPYRHYFPLGAPDRD